MEGITLCIGWDSVLMEQKSSSILQQQSMDFQSHFGGLRQETQQLLIIISQLELTELAHKSTQMSLQVEIARKPITISDISTEAATLLPLMAQELPHSQEPEMGYSSQSWT